MQQADVELCVQVHQQAFPGFFLTFLGPSFLKELYSAILLDASGIGFLSEMDGKPLGFVIETSNPTGLYSRLLRKRWWNFGIASLGALAKKPDILPRLLRAFTMPGQKIAVPICGTLMSIAVYPDA